MSVFQSLATVTPKNDPNGIPYSPQRDMAYNYQNLLTEVFRSLDSQNWSPDVRAVLSELNLTDEELDAKLGEAVKLFAEGLRLFIRSPGVMSPDQALDQSEFDKLDPRIRMVVYGGIGASMTAGFFYCVKDNTMQGQPTPTHFDWVAMLASAQRAAARLLQSDTTTPADTLAAIDSSPDFARQQAIEFEKILKQKANEKQLLQDKMSRLVDDLLATTQVVALCSQFIPYIQKIATNPTFWQKVYQGVCLFMKAILFK